MSLQRRLWLYLLVAAPLVWGLALWISVNRAGREVNELFDTEMVRLARQVEVTLPLRDAGSPAPAAPASRTLVDNQADIGDMALAVWGASGEVLLADREGQRLPHPPARLGFVNTELDGQRWRVYYERYGDQSQWLVAAGQKAYERDDLVFQLTSGQIVPWLLVLPVLLVAMAWAVRRALAPLHQVTDELLGRDARDLRPLTVARAPTELQPLLVAMNGLLGRIHTALSHERRFTADAAHELRNPLAALHAQWDVVRRAASRPERELAEAKLSAGLERMDRLVTQMLALARVESAVDLPAPAAVDWPAVVAQAVNDCLALAERRRIDIACEWPPEGQAPLPLQGHGHLLVVLLRNLLDNAVRYAPAGSLVTLRLGAQTLSLDNTGPPIPPEQLAHLGERFHRPDGQQESGSGLGISIVQRIAALHGLAVAFHPGAGGEGTRVVLQAAVERS